MTRSSTIRPPAKEDRETILRELQEILASPHFCNSKRYPALLKYVVETTLAGNAEQLKERTLGVEVFDRPPDYDTNSDTVVRYTAGEVRKRLALYYHEQHRKPPIQISLPAGSYVPEFIHSSLDELDRFAGPSELTSRDFMPGLEVDPPLREPLRSSIRTDVSGRTVWPHLALLAMLIIAIAAGVGWKYRSVHKPTAGDEFWAPLLHTQSAVLICTGGSVFSQTHLSGVATAGRDIQYPFVSIQSASAIALLSGMIERNGDTTQLQAAASTPLTELRDRPIILLGGYNNQWTMRLLDGLPYRLAPESDASIVDAKGQLRLARNPALPYSSADDYALVARFRDNTTGNWVVVLAGLGRNGTEAAAVFATSSQYMQELRDKIGANLAGRNVEAVLRVNVIDGKTGAPSLVAAQSW